MLPPLLNMNTKLQNYIISGLIILSGIFYYKILNADRFFPAQYGFFVFVAVILFSLLIFQKNKWMGYLAILCAFGFLKTFLMQHAPQRHLFQNMLLYLSIFMTYYAYRVLNLKEDLLKLLLIPAILNIILVIIQAFDHNFLSFMPVDGIGGFLGNYGITSCYLAMTTPIFIRYFPIGIPFLLLAFVLCKSLVGILVFMIIVLFYARKINKVRFQPLLVIFLVLLIIFIIFNKNKVVNSLGIRVTSIIGTLDGIKHNPILGWGLGSYEPTMEKVIANGDMMFLGRKFAEPVVGGLLHNPHNELLFGWWNFGILFPIFIIILAWKLIRKFTIDNLVPFSILLAGSLCSMTYFLSPPAWLLLIMALAIYENNIEEEVNNAHRTTKI